MRMPKIYMVSEMFITNFMAVRRSKFMKEIVESRTYGVKC